MFPKQKSKEVLKTDKDDNKSTLEESTAPLESAPMDQETDEQLQAKQENIMQSYEVEQYDRKILDETTASGQTSPRSESSVTDEYVDIDSSASDTAIWNSGDSEEALDNISVNREALFVPSAINRETEEYLHAMCPSINDILCSLEQKTEEYLHAEQNDDTSTQDDSSESLQMNLEVTQIAERKTLNEIATFSETQSDTNKDLQDAEQVESQSDLYDFKATLKPPKHQVVGEDIMQSNKDQQYDLEIANPTLSKVITLDEELKSQEEDILANGEYSQGGEEIESQSDSAATEQDDLNMFSQYSSISDDVSSFVQQSETDPEIDYENNLKIEESEVHLQDQIDVDFSSLDDNNDRDRDQESPSLSIVSNEIIPKTLNLDGSVKLVLYTLNGEPCTLDFTVIHDD